MRAVVLTPMALGAALLGLCLSQPAHTQATYRWVDKEGHVHYSQQPPARDAAKAVEQKKLGGVSVIDSQMPYALKEAARNYPVVLYSAPECKPGCDVVRELLSKRGVPYREVSVKDAETSSQLKKATGDDKVPALTVGTLTYAGYDVDSLNSALDTAGYPRSRVFTGTASPPTR